jgi:hypothetical protein
MITAGSFTPNAEDWRMDLRHGDHVQQYRDKIAQENGAYLVPVAEQVSAILCSTHRIRAVAGGSTLVTPLTGAGGDQVLTRTYVRQWVAVEGIPRWFPRLTDADVDEVVRLVGEAAVADEEIRRDMVPPEVRDAQRQLDERRRAERLAELDREAERLAAERAALAAGQMPAEPEPARANRAWLRRP